MATVTAVFLLIALLSGSVGVTLTGTSGTIGPLDGQRAGHPRHPTSQQAQLRHRHHNAKTKQGGTKGGKTVWKGLSAAGPFSWDQNEAPFAWGLACSYPGLAEADVQGPRIAL